LMATGAVISIQDMGAAGLTCSAVEMGDKGNLGVRLRLEDVPVRETDMTAYEMMLSESQERMLMVLKPELEAEAKAVFEKWDLDFAIVGETIAEDRFIIEHKGVVKADLPLKALSGTAPEYDRPYVETPAAGLVNNVGEVDAVEGLKSILGSPNYGSKSWVYSQYDTMVMANTIRRPGMGAGIVRVHGTPKSLAFTSDVTPRYCKANPFEGGKQAVAEAYRNLTAVGATPLATTDNMNFGNPEKPSIMGQFVGCIKGIGEACLALDMPIVSGNVSLYNETDGEPILPTPTIGAVGLIKDPGDIITGPAQAGDIAVLLGAAGTHLGQSALLAEHFNDASGDAPTVDLAAEQAHGEFLRQYYGMVRAATDISDGGLAVAAFEMADAADCGLTVEDGDTAFYFGEDQARYLLAMAQSEAVFFCELAQSAGIPARITGSFGGTDLTLGTASIGLDTLQKIYAHSFELAVA
jgi:phosphoribosylformylglycinamidine synthase II